jgi:hypothetical protein
VGRHFEARLTLGWGLLKTPSTRPGELQAYFGLSTQF